MTAEPAELHRDGAAQPGGAAGHHRDLAPPPLPDRLGLGLLEHRTAAVGSLVLPRRPVAETEGWQWHGVRRYGALWGKARRPQSRLPLPRSRRSPYLIRHAIAILWAAVALAGAVGWGVLALHRGETISAAWLVVAAVCTYLVAYRFYSRFLADRVFGLDDRRATPAERLNNGRDFVPTTRWVLFGHHFAAIAGAGPLVGPVLAAQFGFLPGHDLDRLRRGARRRGAGLRHPVRLDAARRQVAGPDGEGGDRAGRRHRWRWSRSSAIMVILLAVLALVVVNALRDSPWGVFTIALHHPDRPADGLLDEGLAARQARSRRRLVGVVLLFAGAGRAAATSPSLRRSRRCSPHSGLTIAYGIMAYGFIASVLPVWMLLAPRDYLSTFMKIGTILLLAARHPARAAAAPDAGGHAVHRRHRAGLRRQALSLRLHHHRLRRDHRLPRAGRVSGTTPKMLIRRERRPLHRLRRDADRVVRRGDGAVAAAVLDPGRLLRDQRSARPRSAATSRAPRRRSAAGASASRRSR